MSADMISLTVDERGQSYTIGIALVFGILFAVTMATFVGGVFLLGDTAGSQEVASAQSGMTEFDTDVNDIAGGAPGRVSELQVTRGQLSYGDEVEITIQASGDGVSLTGSNAVTVSSPTVYYTIADTGRGGGDTTLTYSYGQISRQDERGDSVLVDNPSFQSGSRRTVFVLPQFKKMGNTPSSVKAGGSEKLPIHLVREGGSVLKRSASSSGPGSGMITGNVTIDEQQHTRAWVEFFEDSPGFVKRDIDGDGSSEFAADIDGDGDREVQATFQSKSLLIRQVTVTLGLGEDG